MAKWSDGRGESPPPFVLHSPTNEAQEPCLIFLSRISTLLRKHYRLFGCVLIGEAVCSPPLVVFLPRTTCFGV